ncbi:MAG: threonylcarbamoyl-AMP synthase [Nitrosomonas sp.]|nr:threonylcarbamoyl-AMP synthase [Nitrosomonas sp.]
MIKVKEPPTDETKSIDFQSTPAISSRLQRHIVAAVRQLQEGGTVVFPTETVYGLGADISIPSAVNQIFEIKRRPKNHPLIVHFGLASQLQHWAQEIPESAWKLATNFWPGPLTLILKRSEHIPPDVTGGQNTVGLRIPNHPVALALLHALGAETALAAPSANRFGRISPTTAAHAKDELGQSVSMILDGGPCQVGLESTIVSFINETATVLRPGGIPISALETVLEQKIPLVNTNQLTTRAPGTLASHYAPATPLQLCPAQRIWHHAHNLNTLNLSVAVITWSASTPNHKLYKNIVQFSMPQEPAAYGNQLYATLRQFDQQGFDRLLIETPPDNPAWLAITDRLQRASQTKIQL